jgi:dCMP deaminase
MSSSAGPEIPPLADPGKTLPRVSQIQWDHYYMQVAETVRKRANCFGSKVGAVLVLNNRIVSTGFNGTPAGFTNCEDGGCVRCRDRYLGEIGRVEEASDRELAEGKTKQLDVCVCVHAEANAILSGAKFGNRTEGATLYATHSPCFMCLKEAIQAGVKRVVFLRPWTPSESESLRLQYELLAEHLRGSDQRNFEQLAKQSDLTKGTGTEPREPNLDDQIVAVLEEAELKKTQGKKKSSSKRSTKKTSNKKLAKPKSKAARESEKSSARGRTGR